MLEDVFANRTPSVEWGGDEFVILLPAIEDTKDVMTVAEKIRQELAQPFLINGHLINISTSIGIAIYPEHGTSESALIMNADNAMYYAKKNGRNVIEIYSEEMPKVGRGE